MNSHPMPIPDADSAPFWEGLNEGRLTIQRCGDCGRAQHYLRAICKHCFSSEVSLEQASGTGVVHSTTVVHQTGNAALKEETPFTVALVDLEEGPRVLSRLVGEAGAVPIGATVEARFPEFDDGQSLLFFEEVGR